MAYMKTIDEREFRKYDEQDQIGGMANKAFFMVDRNMLSDFFEASKSKDCCYMTYLVDGGVPKYISVLVKAPYHRGDSEIEATCSRLANFMHIPTVYNEAFILTQNDKPVIKNKMLLSIDCVPKDCEVHSIYEVFGKLKDKKYHSEILSVDDTISVIDQMTTEDIFAVNTDEEKKEIKYSLYDQICFKNCIVGDKDAGTHNMALLYNTKEHKYYPAPMYDYNNAFASPGYAKEASEQYVEAFCRLQPQYMATFVAKLDKVLARDVFDMARDSGCGIITSLSYAEDVNINISDMLANYNKCSKANNLDVMEK